MNISSINNANLYSLKQALNIATLERSLAQDATTMTTLIEDMEEINSKTLEMSVQPYKGSNFDMKL